jgi:hypothetical protein
VRDERQWKKHTCAVDGKLSREHYRVTPTTGADQMYPFYTPFQLRLYRTTFMLLRRSVTCVSHGMGIDTSGLWRTNDPFGTQSSPYFPSRVTTGSNVAVVRSNMNSNKSILGSINERPTTLRGNSPATVEPTTLETTSSIDSII